MCVLKGNMDKCKNLNQSVATRAVQGVLGQARAERRLICGLLPALGLLESDPDGVLFCMLADAGDATTHMHQVLLQAFCLENDIPVIQVDNSTNLAEFCGISCRKSQIECSCALVTRTEHSPWTVSGACDGDGHLLSQAEQTLTDFYECTMYQFPRPTIKLPPLS